MRSIRINDELRLEPATMNDANFLFDIKNEEGARASALVTHAELKWEDHVAWLTRTLKRDDVELYIIMKGDQRIGSWRYDIYPDRVEGSQIVISAMRGQRIGSTVFAFTSDYSQQQHGKKMVMLTAEGNIAAMRYHIANNYKLESYDAKRKCYVWGRSLPAGRSI
jgi:hypothetical protein